MQNLTIIEILKYAVKSLLSSKVFILFVLEALVLLLAVAFRYFMNKKIVDRTCIATSLIILTFYISNYINTIVTFVNNVTTKLMEIIYFPTTLEFMAVMLVSFAIMAITLINRKSNTLVKLINSALPIGISFLFLSIIEYINVNNIEFNEFSVFTDPALTSLYELAMGLFIAWIVGLILYKIDMFVINLVGETNEGLVKKPAKAKKDDIEMPRLKKAL